MTRGGRRLPVPARLDPRRGARRPGRAGTGEPRRAGAGRRRAGPSRPAGSLVRAGRRPRRGGRRPDAGGQVVADGRAAGPAASGALATAEETLHRARRLVPGEPALTVPVDDGADRRARPGRPGGPGVRGRRTASGPARAGVAAPAVRGPTFTCAWPAPAWRPAAGRSPMTIWRPCGPLPADQQAGRVALIDALDAQVALGQGRLSEADRLASAALAAAERDGLPARRLRGAGGDRPGGPPARPEGGRGGVRPRTGRGDRPRPASCGACAHCTSSVRSTSCAPRASTGCGRRASWPTRRRRPGPGRHSGPADRRRIDQTVPVRRRVWPRPVAASRCPAGCAWPPCRWR